MKKFSKIFENKFDMETLDTYLHGIQDLGFECNIEYVSNIDTFIPIEIFIHEQIPGHSIEKVIEFYEELLVLENRLKDDGIQLCYRNPFAHRSSVGFGQDSVSYFNFILRLKKIH